MTQWITFKNSLITYSNADSYKIYGIDLLIIYQEDAQPI
jgi:hypothetical protein